MRWLRRNRRTRCSLIERDVVLAEILTRFSNIPFELHASQCSPAASDFAAQASARGLRNRLAFQSTTGEIGRLPNVLCGSQLRQRVSFVFFRSSRFGSAAFLGIRRSETRLDIFPRLRRRVEASPRHERPPRGHGATSERPKKTHPSNPPIINSLQQRQNKTRIHRTPVTPS